MDLPAGAIPNPPESMILHERSASSGPPSRQADIELPAPVSLRSDEHHQEALKETRQPAPFHPTTTTIRILNPALPSPPRR